MTKFHIRRHALILMALLLIFALNIIIPEDEHPTATICGVPIISTEYSDYATLSIDQILVEKDNLYILYGKNTGIIQVFDINGIHQYTASFYDHMNGAFSMAVYEDALYVRDSVHNIYILRDGKLSDFLERDETSELLDTLNFGATSEDYQVRLGSVWHISEEQKHCIVRRPIYAVLYQNNLLFILSIITVLLIGVWKQSCKSSNRTQL